MLSTLEILDCADILKLFPHPPGGTGCLICCSSLGQNLETSTYVWEICFAVFISIAGLVLFSFLIGNMQVSTQMSLLFRVSIYHALVLAHFIACAIMMGKCSVLDLC